MCCDEGEIPPALCQTYLTSPRAARDAPHRRSRRHHRAQALRDDRRAILTRPDLHVARERCVELSTHLLTGERRRAGRALIFA